MIGRRGRPPHPEPVTPAEARVLELICEGMPNAEIAVRLGLSVNTVKYHVSNLLTKAGVESREALWDTPLEARVEAIAGVLAADPPLAEAGRRARDRRRLRRGNRRVLRDHWNANSGRRTAHPARLRTPIGG